jgi:acyl-CoA synthetase (AMP-forming)/AMP-acid ligase II
MSGAEMVDPDVQEQFSDRFGPSGFSGRAFTPVYGMSEATLAVCMSPVDRPTQVVRLKRDALAKYEVEIAESHDNTARDIVSVGLPVLGMDVGIRDVESGTFVETTRVGEVVIRGPSVMIGYENAGTHGGPGVENGYFPTGDLGFLRDGELFIVGRRKEMIVVRGENYFPYDIETLAMAAIEGRADAVMALGVSREGSEELVLLVEGKSETLEKDRQSICSAVSGTLGISPRDVLFVRRGSLPRTTSGKLQRHRGPALYETYCRRAASGDEQASVEA